MAENIVEKKYDDFKDLLVFLDENGEISLRNDADNNFKKVLILTIASYFETEIFDMLIDFVNKKTNNDKITESLVKNKALSRQYHTFFDWDTNNANKFFSVLGEDFKKDAEKEIKRDVKLDEGIQAFLEIGRIRNKLVHKNFGIYTIDKTAEDVFTLYSKAKNFVQFLSGKLV